MVRADCANRWTRQGCDMAITPHVPLDERLLILRAADPLRKWTSLDDKRICILCDKQFSGRQVVITRGRTPHLRVHCPTDGCNAGPSQWVHPGNPLVSDVSYEDWQRAFTASETTSASQQRTSAAA
jgi:hypothetical protein